MFVVLCASGRFKCRIATPEELVTPITVCNQPRDTTFDRKADRSHECLTRGQGEGKKSVGKGVDMRSG
jgi:hypothetical protein